MVIIASGFGGVLEMILGIVRFPKILNDPFRHAIPHASTLWILHDVLQAEKNLAAQIEKLGSECFGKVIIHWIHVWYIYIP